MCEVFKVSPKKGDILFIRAGVITEWETFTPTQKREYAPQKEPKHAGVYLKPGEVSVHEYLLADWGTPIGELSDLEALAKLCYELGRYLFFLKFMPLNMPEGVSSPPNAMAIF
ncbi:unnamed protein product [Diplocarpon coronariae]|uniref:Uncharacterized protein n=1 Tax=Diplocarpon coronariae TaxID=2795749 RepID=A0A218Z6F6_9HELO|nr:hypothetical protein JHW43_006219 [Diplocarpon mali]OWP03637.1 hypothetical protein B2J93_3258 [Marssonina coronariae]